MNDFEDYYKDYMQDELAEYYLNSPENLEYNLY